MLTETHFAPSQVAPAGVSLERMVLATRSWSICRTERKPRAKMLCVNTYMRYMDSRMWATSKGSKLTDPPSTVNTIPGVS